MTYDHNGNILTLERKQRKYDDLTASYTNETIDNLTYAYKSADKNSLEKVTDAVALVAGFDNGSSSTSNDYTYDINGNLLSDKNKGIDSIQYNFLGKPVRMKFSDGKVITYVYDATGMKLTQKLYHGDTLKNTTDYVNGFVYENGALSFFGSPEGRVVKKGSNLEYEYAIADHQGNTRVVFSSVTPEADEPETGFETGTSDEFIGYTNRSGLAEMNHTASGTYSQLLHGGYNAQVGAAKTIHVYPGDTITAEVYAKYRNVTGTASNLAGFATALTTAFGVSGISTGEALNAYNSLNDFGSLIAAGDRDDNDTSPKGFVTIMLFDKNHNFLDAAWDQIDEDYEQTSTPPAKDPFDVLFKQVVIREEGYVYIFVSNENPTKVDIHFDDLKITHVKSNVIQYNEFYPYGLSASTSWTRENTTDNKYLYNAANELNKTTGWYEMYYRGYDPAIGRMLQIDPYATSYASSTTYNYALNNPVMINDPNGGQAMQWEPGMSAMGVNRYNRIAAMSQAGDYYGDWGEDFSFFRATGGYDVVLSVTQAYSISRDNYGFLLGMGSTDMHFLMGVANTNFGGPTNTAYTMAALDGRPATPIEAALAELNAPYVFEQTRVDCPNCFIADFLRSMPIFGMNILNPFYGAEAIYVDGGWSFVGAEGDAGKFFILVGKDKGKFVSFKELAGGGATDAGLGVELGRIDISGNPYDFTSEYLFGARDKVWLSAGEGISAGGAFSWSSFNGINVYGSSIQISIGLSPWFISGGYNHGVIEKK
jgi:RHS repeat-associated protein